jgi:membrane protease YdiL (CAAX protease family)
MLCAVVGSVIAQSAIATLLIVHRDVALSHAPPRDELGVLAGVACGALLHAALPSKATVAVRTPGRAAIAGLGLLLASVAFAEEVIWRGFVFAALRLSGGPLVAFVGTTVGFAAMHAIAQGWSGLRTHVLTGAAMGLVFWVSGSLASAIALHVTYNLMFLLDLRPERRLAS